MEQRVSLITLGVRDLDRSRAFYERLGWRRSAAAAQGVVFFQVGGMVLSLFPRDDLAEDAGIASQGSGFPGFALAYNVRTRQDVDRVLSEAERVGARVVKPAREAGWGGYSGYFADPDGFLWEVAWNPALPLAEDGSVRLPH